MFFTEEEMTSDPPLPPPVVEVSDIDPEKPEDETSRADLWFNKNKIDRVPIVALSDDIVKVPGQNYVCFSIIKPEDYGVLHHGDNEYKGSLIKIRGVFATKDAAERHIKKLMRIDKHFDVHLVPCFRWAAIDNSDEDDTEYADEKIGEIMKGYFKQENNKIKNVRERIALTEDAENERSEEATRFWEEAQREAKAKRERQNRPKLADSDQQSFTTSLEELARELDIQSNPRTLMSRNLDNPINNRTINAVVSEILLEDDDASTQAAQGSIHGDFDELDPEP